MQSMIQLASSVQGTSYPLNNLIAQVIHFKKFRVHMRN